MTIFWAVSLVVAVSLPAVGQTPGRPQPLAEVDGQAITADEVEKALGAQLHKLQEQIYTLKRQKVDAVVAERLLAKEAARRGVSVPALLDAEVTSGVGLVTEQEIDTFYQTNKTRLQGEETTVRGQIRTQLQNQKLAARREAFLQTLRSRANVVVYLTPPPVARVPVGVDGSPFKGPTTAPVTIVEFQDFHCPFCKRVQGTLAEILIRYGDKVRLVHRDFPLDQLHPAARKGHEAARCADDQGKFWAYHDLLYANAPKAATENLNTYARQIGLDVPGFEQCLGRGKHRATVEKDVEEGTRAGVTGTPTFFINGKMVTGAQPVESFVRLIEDELSKGRLR